MKTLYILLLLLLITGCGDSRGKKTRPVEPRSVKVLTVTHQSSQIVRTYVGEAKASQTAVLTAPYPGTVKSLDVSAGQTVAKGVKVAEVSSESVKSSYDISQATLRQAEDGYKRALMVYEKGGLSQVQFVDIETSLAKARASAAAAKDAYEACVVESPFSGTVSEVFVQQGEEVMIAEPLARIVDKSSMRIYISVPETELSIVERGMSASVDIPALEINGIKAKVLDKGIEASPLSHTYECSLVLDKPLDDFYPGMVCKVYLENAGSSGIVVPTNLIQMDKEGKYVWTVSDGKVYKRRVEVSGYSGLGAVVATGLAEGDQVIREGFQKVSSGMSVKIIE